MKSVHFLQKPLSYKAIIDDLGSDGGCAQIVSLTDVYYTEMWYRPGMEYPWDRREAPKNWFVI